MWTLLDLQTLTFSLDVSRHTVMCCSDLGLEACTRTSSQQPSEDVSSPAGPRDKPQLGRQAQPVGSKADR